MKRQWKKDLQRKLSSYREPAPEVPWADLEAALSAAGRPAVYFPIRMRIVTAALAAVAAGLGIYFSGIRLHPGKKAVVTILPPVVVPAPLAGESIPDRPLLADLGYSLPSDLLEPVASGPMRMSPEEEHHPAWTNAPDKKNAKTGRPAGTVLPELKTKTDDTSESAGAQAVGAADLLSGGEMTGGTAVLPAHRLAVKAYLSGIDFCSHQTLRFGIGLCYEMSRRWSVEGGITYGCYGIEFPAGTGDLTGVARPRQSYLGIPLNLDYRFFDGGRVRFYASAGGMAEIPIRARNADACDAWQFSVNGAFGAEYLLTGRMSVFAEPGLRYSFDNGSDIRTIYKERPFDFNLNIGLRVGL